MDHSNSVKTDRPRYASLTAGLLARKGEAVPVAASFSPEAMAQHLPAKRLAQEFESDNNGSSLRHLTAPAPTESDNDPTSGPIEQRASLIEEAFAQEEGRQEPRLDVELDLFGDESPDSLPNSVEDQSLGLEALVDRAIESAQQKRFDGASPSEMPDTSGPEDLPKSSCSDKKSELVTSIRNAALSDTSAGAGITLDPRRYIRLQVAAMKLDVTKQELVSAALDSFLDTLLEDVFAECACMQKGLI